MSNLSAPPHWDLSPLFPSVDSPEFKLAFDQIVADIQSLGANFDTFGIHANNNLPIGPDLAETYDVITNSLNSVLKDFYLISSYLGCLTSVDATDETARSAESLLYNHSVTLDPLLMRYTAWTGSMDIISLTSQSSTATAHKYSLLKAAYLANHQMSEIEEELAAALRPSGISGWSRLHGEMSALMTADLTLDGETKRLPITKIRSLSTDSNRSTRREAYNAEIATWELHAVPFAAAMNGVKGYQTTVRKRRKYANDLEPTLHMNGIDLETLNAMHAACKEGFVDIQRFYRIKAKSLGIEKLAWYDLLAPVGTASRNWSWDEAKEFVLTNFGKFSPKMRELADTAFRDNWVDAEPRLGKEGGAYCTSARNGDSRIMMNYDGSFSGVSTLAHELGHAYHNLTLTGRPPLQRETPMTLAETASIFCETLSFDAALERADEQETLTLLDTSISRDSAVIVDIHSRFLFETRLFEMRQTRDVSIAEMCNLMVEAQRDTYGEELETYHPYMWAVKGHYYGPTFYNYPYTFGLLFGLGLYMQFKNEPNGFCEKYDDFLSSTGLADARTLAARFGVDIADIGFWRTSIDYIRGQIDQFEALVNKHA